MLPTLEWQAKRLVVIKADGLAGGSSGAEPRSAPLEIHIFVERGAWVEQLLCKGHQPLAPSWALLDTGQPDVIRGNAEFDRFIPAYTTT